MAHKSAVPADNMNSESQLHHNSIKGFSYALLGSALVSTNYVTAKYGLKGFNPEAFSLIWTAAASVYTVMIVILSGRKKQLVLPANAVPKILILGLATGVGMILAWSGLALLDPSFASFIWRFAPVLTIMLSSVFLGERLRLRELIPVAVMVIGGGLSTLGRWHIVGTGVILTLLAACAVSVQMLIAKMEVGEIHPNVLVFYRVSIAAVCICIWNLVTGRAHFEAPTSFWAITLLGAFLGPSVSFLFTFRSYKYWDLSRSSIVLTAQPLMVLPMAYLAFGKIPTGTQLLGGFIIVLGALWLMWIHRARMIHLQ